MLKQRFRGKKPSVLSDSSLKCIETLHHVLDHSCRFPPTTGNSTSGPYPSQHLPRPSRIVTCGQGSLGHENWFPTGRGRKKISRNGFSIWHQSTRKWTFLLSDATSSSSAISDGRKKKSCVSMYHTLYDFLGRGTTCSCVVEDNGLCWTLWGHRISNLFFPPMFFASLLSLSLHKAPTTKNTTSTPPKAACELLCSHTTLAQLPQITACTSTGESCSDVWCEACLAFACSKNKS